MKILLITNLCHGVIRPMSPMFCPSAHATIFNILEESQKYDLAFIINDAHKNSDNESKYIKVPHFKEDSQDCYRLQYYENEIKSKHMLFSIKNTFSAINSEHNKKLILNYQPELVVVGGFTATHDVVPTAIDLSQIHPNILISADCTDDISTHHKEKSLEYVRELGIGII